MVAARSAEGVGVRTKEDPSEDSELTRVLRRWEMDGASVALDRRILASYRSEVADRTGKRRWMWAVWPLPVALAFGLMLLVLGFVAGRKTAPGDAAGPRDQGVQLAQAVERPVVTNTSLSGFVPVPEVEVRRHVPEDDHAR
jgi:hypothetical protein